MINIKDFKEIADHIMDDIKADDHLKNETLHRCMNKRQIPTGKLLAAAACFVLIFGFVNMSGILRPDTQPGEQGIQENNIMAATDNGIDTLVGPQTGTLPEAVNEWQVETPEEARKLFGSDFLTPSYIPEGFKVNGIFASGINRETAEKIILSYLGGDQSFLVREQKSEGQNGFADYKQIDINGAVGYLKSGAAEGDKKVDSFDIELHWFKNGIQYSVVGALSENEGIKVAESMK